MPIKLVPQIWVHVVHEEGERRCENIERGLSQNIVILGLVPPVEVRTPLLVGSWKEKHHLENLFLDLTCHWNEWEAHEQSRRNGFRQFVPMERLGKHHCLGLGVPVVSEGWMDMALLSKFNKVYYDCNIMNASGNRECAQGGQLPLN